MANMRVVSLVPSSTETLLALGGEVIACTRFCEQPGLRHVGGTKNPDLDAIIALQPDVVVMDREENRIEDHDALVDAGVEVFVSDVRSVDDAIALVGDLTELTHAPDDTYTMCQAHRVGRPLTSLERRTAFVPIWRRPWMSIAAGTYGASLLALLSIDLVTADLADPYPTVELEDIASAPAGPRARSERTVRVHRRTPRRTRRGDPGCDNRPHRRPGSVLVGSENSRRHRPPGRRDLKRARTSSEHAGAVAGRDDPAVGERARLAHRHHTAAESASRHPGAEHPR